MTPMTDVERERMRGQTMRCVARTDVRVVLEQLYPGSGGGVRYVTYPGICPEKNNIQKVSSSLVSLQVCLRLTCAVLRYDIHVYAHHKIRVQSQFHMIS